MGPGSHGIAGSVAQAGMALRGMREIGGSLKNQFSKANDLRNLKKARGVDSILKTANKGMRNGGISGVRNALTARKNTGEYKAYKKDLQKRFGTSSEFGASAKAYAPLAGVVGGVGAAITGAGTGQFLSKASTNAAIEGALLGGIANLPDSFKKFMQGDATKAEDCEKRAKGLESMEPEDAKNLSKEDIKKISIELGISEGRVRKLLSSKDGRRELATAYHSVGNAMKWGMDKEEAKKNSKLYRIQADFDKKKLEGGFKSVIDSIDGPLTIRNDGTYANVNGEFLKIDDFGDRSLKDDESVSVGLPSQKGKSVQIALQENLNANEEYQELLGEVTPEKATAVRKANNQTQLAYDDMKAARKKLDEARVNNPGAPDTDLAISSLLSAYNDANSTYQGTKEISDKLNSDYRTAENKMNSIEKQTKKVLLRADEHFSDAGITPTFTEVAIHNPERTEIHHNGEERTFEIGTQQYTITTSTKTTQRTQIINDAQNNSDTIRENNTTSAYTSPTSASRDDVRQFIVDQNIPSISALERTYQDMANGATPPLNLAQMEAQVNSDITSKINQFTLEPASVMDPIDVINGTTEISAAFADNNIAQEYIGEPSITASAISAVNANNVGDSISSALRGALQDVLEKFEGREVYIKISRPVAYILHYKLYLRVSKNSFAHGDIAINSNLAIEELANGPITIICRNGNWYMQQ